LLGWIARGLLWVLGWEAAGAKAADEKLVLVAAPHTSNWDLLYLLLITFALVARVSWLGKHTLFFWPLGPILKALGGIPIDRAQPEDVVEQIARVFREADSLALAITPVGTRSYSPYWKSGFYRIANAAGVPIQLGFADYPRRRGGYGPIILPSDDIRADMDQIRAFFEGKVGYRPEQAGPMRLHEEDTPPA
jgi:1-acyl-sn-glycerol-3-phosphate acyltransferase